MRRVLSTLLMSSALAGCSTVDTYLNRPTRYDSLPQGFTHGAFEPKVATLSLNADRRLMITDLATNHTCSEPPPDAATSLLAQESLDAEAKSKAGAEAQAKLDSEFQANAAMIAHRTAAVEFWRTTSFSYCQLLMNGMKEQATRYLEAAEKIAPEFGDRGSGQDGAPGGTLKHAER